MTTSPPVPSPTVCPLCGRGNACGMAAGQSTCWCMQVQIPPALLERLPPEARGVACVCADCVAAFHAGTLDTRLAEARP